MVEAGTTKYPEYERKREIYILYAMITKNCLIVQENSILFHVADFEGVSITYWRGVMSFILHRPMALEKIVMRLKGKNISEKIRNDLSLEKLKLLRDDQSTVPCNTTIITIIRH